LRKPWLATNPAPFASLQYGSVGIGSRSRGLIVAVLQLHYPASEAGLSAARWRYAGSIESVMPTTSTNNTTPIRRESRVRDEAIFLNGVYRAVLEDILKVQEHLPEHIMFLQPYAKAAITKLRDNPPSVDDPVRLYLSTTDDLPTVSYEAEIVGWENKSTIAEARRRAITRLIWMLQPTEDGLYNSSGDGTGQSTNLLHIRRLRRLGSPFSVQDLTKTSDNTPVSPDRSTAGGWSYVQLLEPR
jgi:hypothetical protein